MNGRESKSDNDLMYTCSLIEYISRKTKNDVNFIFDKIGEQSLIKIYNLAEIYHCDNIDRVSDDFINEFSIPLGDTDYVARGRYTIPTHFEMGKIYKRLAKGVAKAKNVDIIEALTLVYQSPLSEQLHDYNIAVYYDNPENILRLFLGTDMIGRMVKVWVDRPLGSTHPTHNDIIYPINYGYVKEFVGGDGKLQYAYILGVDKAVESFQGIVIAIIRRKNDVEEKWVVAKDFTYTKEEIKAQTNFIEKYFDTEILMIDD